jgi:four helix bundle protein
MASGSQFETKEHLMIAVDEKYIDDKTVEELEMLIVECLKLLNGYINFLVKMKTKDKNK